MSMSDPILHKCCRCKVEILFVPRQPGIVEQPKCGTCGGDLVPVKKERPAPVEVKVGQVWMDNDPRHNYKRLLKVLAIENGKAIVQHPRGLGSKTRIRLDRFKPTTTGYKLVDDVP